MQEIALQTENTDYRLYVVLGESSKNYYYTSSVYNNKDDAMKQVLAYRSAGDKCVLLSVDASTIEGALK